MQVSQPVFPVLWLSALLCGLCGHAQAADLRIDGSSTVYPITIAIAGKWAQSGHPKLAVAQNGSGAGIKLLIAGTIPFADSSRAMSKAEIETATAHGIEIIEVPIAMDGITVVVNVDNAFLTAITTQQLKAIWNPASSITTWSQVAPEYPAQTISLFRPGNNSGTLEYFTSVIMGKAGAIRQDALADEDFSVLTQGVIANRYALSFCGWAYARANAGMLRAVPIDNGSGPQSPNRDSIISGAYPLSRPLFIYLNKAALAQTEVGDFVTFYLAQVAQVAEEVGYVPLPEALYQRIRDRVAKGIVGSPFSLAPKGTSIEKAINGDFTPAATAVLTSATAVSAAVTTSEPRNAPPAASALPEPRSDVASPADAGLSRALINRLRDASLTLARLSLDPSATVDELLRADAEERSALNDLRLAAPQAGSLTLAQAIGSTSAAVNPQGFSNLVDRLHLRPGATMALSEAELAGFKHDLRDIHDEALRHQLSISLSQVSTENLPAFVESVSRMESSASWSAIDVVHCYALGEWTLQ
jgi:phosphate transport system substrate-binding protein